MRFLVPGGGRVLDLGAGTGKASAALLAAGHEVVAVEPSTRMLARLRALRPGGTLGMVWNLRDDTVDWVRRVWSTAQLGVEQEVRCDTDDVGAPFGPPERFTTRHEHVTDRAGTLDLIASRSCVIVLPEVVRAELLARVDAVLDDVFGPGEPTVLPYLTHCTRFTRG